MTHRLNVHPVVLTLLAVALTTGVGISAGIPGETSRDRSPVTLPDTTLVDVVVVELTRQIQELHIPPESPIWSATPALCAAAAGIMSMFGIPADCGGSSAPPPSPPVQMTTYTLYIGGHSVRMDFGGQSMVGDVLASGDFGNWRVLDRQTGSTIPWRTDDSGGPGLAALGGSVMAQNLLSPIGGIRTTHTGPNPIASPVRPGTWSSVGYNYTVSGGVRLPDGNESGVAIQVKGVAHYGVQGGLVSNITVARELQKLSGRLIFQILEPPPALAILRQGGAALAVGEDVEFSAYLGGPAAGVQRRTLLMRGFVRSSVDDARLDQVPASMFGTTGAQACDCSCTSLTKFQRFAAMSEAEQERNPETMSVVACGLECATQWALRCHQ